MGAKPGAAGPAVYLFLDESGNLDFGPKGTRHFVLTSVAMRRPFGMDAALNELRFDLVEAGEDVEYFHASEDLQQVRNSVFATIAAHRDAVIRADAVITRKAGLPEKLQDPPRFYGFLLRHLVQQAVTGLQSFGLGRVVVITDALPLKKKRQAFEKACKKVIKETIGRHAAYRLLHYASRSCFGLQVADYLCWAVFRKWERGDPRSYDLVENIMTGELDATLGGPTPGR